MKMEKWRAWYCREKEVAKNVNPFGLRFSAKLAENADVVAGFPDDVIKTDVEIPARAATPEGYIFVSVEKVKDF